MQISASRSCPFCGDNHKSKPFCTYSDGYHCYSCGAHKSSDRSFQSNNSQTKMTSCAQLPNTVSEFTLETRAWLSQYDVDDALISKYKIMQVEDGSIVLPNIEDNEIKSFQRRWFNPRRILTYGKKLPFYSTTKHNNNAIVIVEDFISCVKVGEVVQSVACLGTHIENKELERIVNEYENIYVWLDGDAPGIEAAAKLMKRLGYYINMYNRKRAFAIRESRITNVCTEKDPKCYTKNQINNILFSNERVKNV